MAGKASLTILVFAAIVLAGCEGGGVFSSATPTPVPTSTPRPKAGVWVAVNENEISNDHVLTITCSSPRGKPVVFIGPLAAAGWARGRISGASIDVFGTVKRSDGTVVEDPWELNRLWDAVPASVWNSGRDQKVSISDSSLYIRGLLKGDFLTDVSMATSSYSAPVRGESTSTKGLEEALKFLSCVDD